MERIGRIAHSARRLQPHRTFGSARIFLPNFFWPFAPLCPSCPSCSSSSPLL